MDLEPLQFPTILELAAGLAATEPGKSLLRLTPPATEPAEVQLRLDATAEMIALIAAIGRPDLDGIVDLDETLSELARPGVVLPLHALRDAFSVCTAVTRARHFTIGRLEDHWIHVRDLVADLADFSELDRLGKKILTADGQLAEDASPKLVSIRGQLSQQRRRVGDRAQELLRERSSLFQDNIVVERGERVCLPLRADAKGRLPAIVHERSQTGQTFFVEPIELVDLNNEVAQLRIGEAREIERILADASARLAARAGDLGIAIEAAAALDELTARALFSRMIDGTRPKPSAHLSIVHGRHPLLDERLATLRKQVLGEDGPRGSVVPVDLEIAADRRGLVLSGPNAGGKTATLKLIGVLTLLAQSGFFVPADSASLPIADRVVVLIGDSQDLLADLSSFSSAMTRLGEVLPQLGAGSLVLLDELGAATDPEEGGALAAAVLEHVVAAGARAVVTTHLAAVKERAAERDDLILGAMEFDSASGRPTFRFLTGVGGRSHALELAARAGLPEAILARAREHLGEEHGRRDRLLEAAEEARACAEKEREDATLERRRAHEEAERLTAERADLVATRKQLRVRLQREMDQIQRAVERRLEAAIGSLGSAAEVARVRSEILASTREAVAAIKPEQQAEEREIQQGDRVRLEGLGTIGKVTSIDGERAVLEVKGKKMHVRVRDLELAEEAGRRPGSVSIDRVTEEPMEAELLLLGKTVDEAIDLLGSWLDRALLDDRAEVRVIHGHGTGRLRSGVRRYLDTHPAVAAHRPGGPGEGGHGATVVTLADGR